MRYPGCPRGIETLGRMKHGGLGITVTLVTVDNRRGRKLTVPSHTQCEGGGNPSPGLRSSEGTIPSQQVECLTHTHHPCH